MTQKQLQSLDLEFSSSLHPSSHLELPHFHEERNAGKADRNQEPTCHVQAEPSTDCALARLPGAGVGWQRDP